MGPVLLHRLRSLLVTGYLCALLVPMRTLSCALRQWFAGQSRSLQQRCCQLQLN